MNRPQLLPDSPDEKDTAKFLRRFSELISVGQSASYLRHAAGLIEDLIERIRQTEELLRQQEVTSATHLASRRRAEAELEAALLANADLRVAQAERQLKLTAAESGFAEERQLLRDRADSAEALLSEASALLQELQSQVAPLGVTHEAVPVSTLLLLRAQFESLASEFKRSRDTVSHVMCEIGVRTIDQVLAANDG